MVTAPSGAQSTTNVAMFRFRHRSLLFLADRCGCALIATTGPDAVSRFRKSAFGTTDNLIRWQGEVAVSFLAGDHGESRGQTTALDRALLGGRHADRRLGLDEELPV